jgi:hypothetical protein
MSEKPDSGQAFPHVQNDDTRVVQLGMSIRQLYAGMALQGLLAAQSSTDNLVSLSECASRLGISEAEVSVRAAFNVADAMIKHEETQ